MKNLGIPTNTPQTLEGSPQTRITSPGRNPVQKHIKTLRKAIPVALALSSLPLAVRADTQESEGERARTESVGRENSGEAVSERSFSPELEDIFRQLVNDREIQADVSKFRAFLSGETEGDKDELVRMIRRLDDRLSNHPLKKQFDDLVRAEIRKQDFSSLDNFLNELGISLSDQEKWAFYFYITSLLMGLGIAFDVMASNVGRFRKSKSVRGNLLWASELGASHIAFPIAGGAMAAVSMGVGSMAGNELIGQIIERTIGGFSMGLIGWILYQEIFKGEEEEGEEGAKAVQNSRKATRAALIANLSNLWAVSADALFSGPAKYVETTLKYWRPSEIRESIVIGGIVVFICSMISGLAALKINRKYQEAISKDSKYSPEVVERIEKICLAGESGILGYFALNAGINNFLSMDVSRPAVMLLSALGTAVALKWKGGMDKKAEVLAKESPLA